MINSYTLLTTFLLMSMSVQAATTTSGNPSAPKKSSDYKANYALRGFLEARAGRYTQSGLSEKNSQRHHAQFEQESRMTPNLTFMNQLRWNYNSLYTDVAGVLPEDSKDTHKIYIGDNYFKYKASSWVLQTGYQEIAWGESFGFNYADIVNPKDLKRTFYSDSSDARIPLFLANFKYFFSNGSIQLIYSPEPKYSENLPVALFTKGLVPQTVSALREKSPKFFEQHEYGGKLSTSFWGIDASAFYFSYIDRDAIYLIKSVTPTTMLLQEDHLRVTSMGVSVAKSLFDNFVFRTDYVITQDKEINSLTPISLISTPTTMSNLVVSIDTPTYNNFSAVFIYASSQLSEEIPAAFREQSLSYGIAKLSYDFGEEKTFDLSYTHELSKVGHSVQSLITWPVSSNLDLKLGAEMYWGAEDSQFYKVKNISSVFLGIKNYFQL